MRELAFLNKGLNIILLDNTGKKEKEYKNKYEGGIQEFVNFLDEKKTPLVNKNEVCLFMKGTPDVPQCGFSLAVSNILKHLEVKFKGVNILENSELRQGIKEFSDWPTIPQLYIKEEFIGGCDIVKEMFEKGELQTKLKEKKISYKSN